MRKWMLVLPAVLLAACTDGLEFQEGNATSSGAGNSSVAEPTGEATENALHAFYLHIPQDCADNSVFLEGHYYYDDGTYPSDVSCEYQLSDGTTLQGCGATVSLPTAETITLTVRDNATGAVAVSQPDTFAGPAALDLQLSASGTNDATGMYIAWNATANYGAATQFRVDVDPVQNTVVPDPHIFENAFGVLAVTKPGPYTISVSAFVSFEEFGCSQSAQATVEVPASCSSTH